MTATTEGFDSMALPDLERRLANMIRIGKVLQIDTKNNRVRVQTGKLQTDWIMFRVDRSSGRVKRWSMLAVGEPVVLACPSGDLRQAIILGSLPTAEIPPASDDENIDVFGQYEDGTRGTYDMKEGRLTWDLVGSKVVADKQSISLMVGSVGLKITSAGVNIIGGKLTHDGVNVGKNHSHMEQGDGKPVGPPQ